MAELPVIPLLLYASASDIRSRTIPDGAVCCIAALGAVNAALYRIPWLALLARPVPALALLLLAAWRGGCGGGDVKLYAALCLFRPPFQSVTVLLLALAAAYAAGKAAHSGSVPFAPFLCGSFLILTILGRELF